MKKVDTIAALRARLKADRLAGKTVGFVPTMGYLHEGHLSLMRRSNDENDVTVASIFVNPLQFGPQEDFDKYPRDPARDAEMSRDAGVTYLFSPGVEEMYPRGGVDTSVRVGAIGEICEGAARPGHFDGVATVCAKLFNIVGPCRAYFGQKDAQQLAVIEQIVGDLDIDVEVVRCPTVREADGLAMSSRNKFLAPDERAAAAILSRALFEAAENVRKGVRAASDICGFVSALVGTQPLVRLQYVQVVDPRSFEGVEVVRSKATIVLAAFVGSTRLIDNIEVSTEG